MDDDFTTDQNTEENLAEECQTEELFVQQEEPAQEPQAESLPPDPEQRKYVRRRTWIGCVLLLIVVVFVVAAVGRRRFSLTREELFQTNRVRIDTVINGLSAGITEKDGLNKEYDRLYTAKLENAQYHFGDFGAREIDSEFVKEVAKYADVDSAAIIDGDGKVYGSWRCDYDFTKKRFRMLRICARSGGMAKPFSIAYRDGTKRFFARKVAENRILVFAQDWTETERNIDSMTSWEAVLRGMISVDTVSIAVSLKDYTFLYNPIDDLTGKDALQNGMPIGSLGESYEGVLTFGGEDWCVVGKQWNDAVVFVMTKANTDLANDSILVIFIGIVFIIFIVLVSAYGIIINRDNIRIGKMPSYLTLLRRKTGDGTRRNILNFNLTVGQKLFPIALLGVIVVTALSFYIQSINRLASIAYESNRAIEEIGNKLTNNRADAEAVNTEYKDMFLNKCTQIASMLEENPQYVLDCDPESDDVHEQPAEQIEAGQIVSGVDCYGNPVQSVSDQEFLQELCAINAIETISVFDESGRILATSGDRWYYVMSGSEEEQSYPFWEILAEHRDFYAQDLELDDEGVYSQYIGSAFHYYTTQNSETGATEFVSRKDYESQLAGTWTGEPIQKHRGMVQVNIAPERLRSVMETATLTYVADHTTIHGTGYAVIFDDSEEHVCVYSPRETDIGKTASTMGYSATAFNVTGEMYNGFETVNGERYFQTFKLADEYNYYIGTAVPLSTVYSTRDELAVTALIASLIGFLVIFLYTCMFGEKEERMYVDNVNDPDWHIRNAQDLMTLTMPSGKTRKTRTAASRWDAVALSWWTMTPDQKFSRILKIVAYIFAVFMFGCIVLSRSGAVSIDAINYVYEGVWTKGFNIFAMTNGIITLIVVLVVAKAAELIIENVCVNIGSRAETLGHLFSSVIHYGVALYALFYLLYLGGLDTGSLIASAGIMSLVIGLGAQSMIQDILAGVFIVFEGAFRVGDVVTIGDFRGNVLEIGLRTTKIEDAAQNIKVFNNSNLSGILNMTKQASYAAVEVGMAYEESIEYVEAVLAEELPKVAERLPSIIDGPFYKGISELASSSVNIKVVALCKEQDRLQLCRDLNRELFVIFKKYGITIPFPQVTLSQLEPPTEEEQEANRRFIEEQRAKKGK